MGVFYPPRHVTAASMGTGRTCFKFAIVVSKKCHSTTYCPKPADCVMTDWSDWSSCSSSCGGGQKKRARVIKSQPMYGGKQCPFATQTAYCSQYPCPTDCAYTWGDWTLCTMTCGGGVTSRDPKITVKAAYGGKTCPGPVTAKCYTHDCPSGAMLCSIPLKSRILL